MSGPFPFARQVSPIEQLLSAAPTWDGLSANFAPAPVSDGFKPGDELMKVLYAFSRTAEGRQMFEWLADLTVRAPYPHVGNSFEAAALAAAKHEARAAVGQSIFLAIATGEKLLDQQRSQSHEQPA